MGATREGTDYTGIFDGRPPPEKPHLKPEDRKLAGDLKEWIARSHRFRLGHERQWELNQLFLKGDQLVGRHKVSGDIVRLSTEDSKKLRSQNNMLRPTSRSLVGKLSKLVPTYTAVPATTDFEEAHGARAADLVLQYLRSSLNLDRVYTDLCGYLPWAGNAFLQLAWNPLGGKTVAFCDACNYFTYNEDLIDQACPNCVGQWQQAQIAIKMQTVAEMDNGLPVTHPPEPPTADGAPPPGAVPLLVEAREGEVQALIRDPKDVFLPPGCTDIRTIKQFGVREIMEVSEAAARYPLFASYIKPDASTDMAASSMTNRFGSMDSGSGIEDLEDQVAVWEFHEAATERHKDGRILVMINDAIVEEKPGLYKKLNRLPLYQFGFDPVEGEIYREAFITQAWHRQRELNRLESQMREGIERTLHPFLMNPIGSRISNEEFEADSGQVINFNPSAGQVDWINPPPLPDGLWNRKADLMQDIRVLASITESEQGLNTADPNGRAMAIINAEADQQVGPIVHRNNSEWRDFYRGCLILYRLYAHPERIAAVAGPQGTQTVYLRDLELLNPGWDLRTEQEDGLSRNPAVRLTQAMDLAQIGFFLDPMTGMIDKKAFARYAKLGLPDQGYDDEATETAAAAGIPVLISQGIPWQPHMYDDPVIFEKELRSWLRGPGRKIDPMITMQVEQVWMYYAQWAMTGMMGVPPAPAGPGQPASGQAGPGGASKPGQVMSAPGGTPNNTGLMGTVMGQAQATVSAADRQGESAARGQLNHES